MLETLDRLSTRPLDSFTSCEHNEQYSASKLILTPELATKMKEILESKSTPIVVNINLSDHIHTDLEGYNLSKLFRDNDNPKKIILNVKLFNGSVESITFANQFMPHTDELGNKTTGQVIYRTYKNETMSRVRNGDTIMFSNGSCLELDLSGNTGMGHSATVMNSFAGSNIVSAESIVASVDTIDYLNQNLEQSLDQPNSAREKSPTKKHIVEFGGNQNETVGLSDLFSGRISEVKIYITADKNSYILNFISKDGKFFWVKDNQNKVEIGANASIQFKNLTRDQDPYFLHLSNSEPEPYRPKNTTAISFDIADAKKLDPEFVALVVSTIVNYLIDRFGIKMKPEYFAGDGFIFPLSNFENFLEAQITAEWFLRDINKELGLTMTARIAYAGCSLSEEQMHKAIEINKVQETREIASLTVADVVQSTAKKKEINDYINGTDVFSVVTPQVLDDYLLSLKITDDLMFESIKNQLLKYFLTQRRVGVVGGTEKIELGETDVLFIHNPSVFLPIIKEYKQKTGN